ncbi:hypothetical protein F8M41_013993 [Gigaspora margarita]|uniref:Uncharacterized protein n=1 Tax=Gigaspora margarita TaxID=4874 RepID=A0A8H3WXN7_GIGMA|nr:hypothetical protein F8M41_013993 [Gigaspora margarita]
MTYPRDTTCNKSTLPLDTDCLFCRIGTFSTISVATLPCVDTTGPLRRKASLIMWFFIIMHKVLQTALDDGSFGFCIFTFGTVFLTLFLLNNNVDRITTTTTVTAIAESQLPFPLNRSLITSRRCILKVKGAKTVTYTLAFTPC